MRSSTPSAVMPGAAQEDCDRDFFMTPEEALDYGLIDQVVSTKTSHIAKPLMPSLEEAF